MHRGSAYGDGLGAALLQTRSSTCFPDIHIAFLQIKSTLLGPGLPSHAMLLFNCPIRGIMPIINKPPINSNGNDEHFEALVKGQPENDKNHDTSIIMLLFCKGSTIVVQWEAGGPWTHGTVVGRGYHNYNSRSYMICVTKTGWLITRNSKHIKARPTTAEQYLWNRLGKNTMDTVDGILKQFKKHRQQNMTYTQWASTGDAQWNNMKDNTSSNHSQDQIAVKNE